MIDGRRALGCWAQGQSFSRLASPLRIIQALLALAEEVPYRQEVPVLDLALRLTADSSLSSSIERCSVAS